MKKIILSQIAFLSIFTTIGANELGGIDDFESLLNDVSDTATKKSINVDYLPSVTTIIDAQTFIDGGIVNIGEALGMLPGIQMQLTVLGQNVTTVRGFKNPKSMISDKIKILVDGVAINNEAAGTSGFYMDFPMHLVKRIEVLRGPGSTVYGAGAFYGAINVITKLGNESKENQLYIGAGSYKYMTAGANIHKLSGDWKIFTDGYYAQNDKSIKNAKRVSDEAMENLSLGVKLVNGGFEFLTRYKSSDYENFYTQKADFEPNNDKGHQDSYFFSQLSYKTSINEFKLDTKLNFSSRESDAAVYFSTDVEQMAYIFSVVDVSMLEAFHARDHQVENNVEAEAIVTFPKFISNDISIGVGVRKTDLTTSYFSSSIENAISQNLDTILNHQNYDYFYWNDQQQTSYWDNPTSNDLFDKTTRTIKYGYIQDLISLSEDTDFVLGLRVDDYSDVGTNLSSRAGLVHRLNDKLIFKLLYGSAFRVPSFYEAYTSGHIYYRHGVESILPEETKTYESSLIYLPDFNNRLSLNVYYSELNDVIDIDNSSNTYLGYQNMKDRVNKGVEFEYFFRTKETHNLYINATYTDAQYTVPSKNIDQNMPDISDLMLKAMYIYSPIKKLSFGSSLQYYSQTTQEESKTKDTTVEKQYMFDETITYKLSNSSQMRLTIKNVLDKELHLPSYKYEQNGGELREGRNYFLSYSYLF